QTRADQQVLALIAGILRQLVDLAKDAVEAVGQALAERDRSRVVAEAAEGLGGETLGLIDQRRDAADALVGGVDRADRLTDAILQTGQIAGPLVEALGREERGRVVEGGVHLVAGGQADLGTVQQSGGLLEEEEVTANASGKLDVVASHELLPLGA